MPPWWATRPPLSPSIRWSSGSACAMSRRKLGTCLTSKKTPEIRITGTNTALTTAGADSKLGIACESATPSAAKQTTPSDREQRRARAPSGGQPRPKNTRPATTTMPIWIAALVTAFSASPPR